MQYYSYFDTAVNQFLIERGPLDYPHAASELFPSFAFHLFLEYVALGFLFDKTRTIAKLLLPLASPLRSDPVFALDLALELPAFRFGLYFTGTIPEFLFEFASPPALIFAGICSSLATKNGCHEKYEDRFCWTHGWTYV